MDRVQVITLEESPFAVGSDGKPLIKTPKVSTAGLAAQAVVGLLQLDLGPPYGPQLFGVHWEQEYGETEDIHLFIKHGFVFPDGAVVIVVGMKPVDEFWPGALFPQPESKQEAK
jgi:hypothetical protein